MKLVKFALTSPIVAISVALFAATTSFGAFKYQSTLTVGGYTGEETLEGFPLLVRVPAAVAEKCQADGRDIVFTSADGATTFAHEIDEWDASGESLVWVRIPALPKGMAFTMKFGDDSFSEPAGSASNIWGNDYFGVWHFNEGKTAADESYTAGNVAPSGALMDLVLSGGKVSEVYSVNGAVGNGLHHQDAAAWANNNNVLRTATGYNSLSVGDTFTVSGWFAAGWQTTGTDNSHNIMGRDSYRAAANGGWLVSTGERGALRIYDMGNSAKNTSGSWFVKDAWQHITIVYSGTAATAYLNGGKSTTTWQLSKATEDTGKDRPFSLGGPAADSGCYGYAGSYDEVRLMRGASTAERVKADYETVSKSDYVSFGPIEEMADTDTLTVSGQYGDYGAVEPGFGVTSVSVGTVVCTAVDEEIVVSDDLTTRIVGWELEVTDAAGVKTRTSGEGLRCEYTHAEGAVESLVWRMDATYRISASADDVTHGTVSGTGMYKNGATVTLKATSKQGYRFVRWEGDLPSGISAENPIVEFMADAARVLTAVFADTVIYTFSNVVKGASNYYYWLEPQNWADIDGDGTGDIPPNDGSATVVIDCSATTQLMLDAGETKVYGLYFKGVGQISVQNWSGRYFAIGAGGVDGDSGAKMPSFGTQGVKLLTSQTWRLKSAGLASGKVTGAADVVWTVSGPYSANLSMGDFNGRLRTNVAMSFPANAALMEVYNYDDPEPAAATLTMLEQILKYACSADGGTITTPVKMDLTGQSAVGISIGHDDRAFSWVYDFAGPWTGVVAQDGSSELSFSSAYPTILSDIGRIVFSGPSSGFGNMTVKASNVMLDIAGPESVFGASTCNFVFGRGAARGHLGGAIFGDGVDVGGTIVLDPYRQWNSSTVGDAQIAMAGSGKITLRGNIINTNETAYVKQSRMSSAGQLEFYAPKAANIEVRGSIIGAAIYPVRILGDGEVTFAGANAQMELGPLVQSGTLRLADDSAAGQGAIQVGAAVPSARTIAAMTPMNNTERAIGKLNVSTHTYSGLKKSMFDGYQPVAGDTILLNFHTGTTGLFRLINDADFEALPTAKENERVVVTSGEHFAGCSFFSVSGERIWHKESDTDAPSVAVLTAGPVTIANDIFVNDNKSAGARTIGGATADVSTFSGTVVLSNDVTFAAVEGGEVRFTGEIDNTDGHDVSFAGLGTVRFVHGLDVAGRAIVLTVPAKSVPVDELKKWTIASGLSGTPASIELKTDDGSAVGAEWVVRKSGSRLTFANKNSGLTILVR